MRSSLMKLRVPLAIVAGVSLGLLTGCAPSAYQLEYYKMVDKNKDLERRWQDEAQKSLACSKENKELKDKLASAGLAKSDDEKDKDANELRQVLLLRLQKAIEGTPCEAMLRGKDYIIVTRFSFESGKAELGVQARSDLRKISDALAQSFPGATCLVAGHADNQPIRESKYTTNWELSGARALAVMTFLAQECKVPGEKIAYAGYGEFRPVADNGTIEGREKNRRIEIIVTP